MESSVKQLKPENRVLLEELVADAVSQQQKAVDQAVRKVLRHVPVFLRGPVKRVLIG